MSNTAIHRARASALGQPGPLGQAVQSQLSARGRPCEQPPGGSHVLGPAGEVPVDGEGGRLVAGGWECGGLLAAQEPRPAGEKRVDSRSSGQSQRGCGGQQAREEGPGAAVGGGEEGRVLDLPKPGWLEVPSPGPGRGQDRKEKHSSLPILPAATPTLSARHCLLP